MDVYKLKNVIPDGIIAELTPAFLTKSHIDGPKRLSNFLGQCMQESGNFHYVQENLNYSAHGLQVTFPKYFPMATTLPTPASRR